MIGFQETPTAWILTLRRPEKANSLTANMLEALIRHVKRAKTEQARALILTAEGRNFSAGADLDEAPLGLAKSPLWDDLSTAISDFPGLSVAALNGTVAGGAMGIILACDLRIAVPTARFFYPVMKLGFLPQPADPARLVRLIGPARTKYLLMAGQKINADEALAWGLVDRLVAPEELATVASDLTRDCAAASPQHVAQIRQMIEQR